jgi:2-iminobutanoate/2-iminopropanoate deaminase
MYSIQTDNAPIPAGHYSQAVVHNGFVFVAGQLPITPGQSEHHVGTMAEQAEQTLRNVEAILQAAGSGMDRVVQMTVYVSDIALWGEVNAVYARVMGANRPARAIVPVRDLHFGYQIEIQAIATVSWGEERGVIVAAGGAS